TFDLMDPSIADHSTNVAYWVFRLASELALPEENVRELVVAGMLHDIGAFSLHDRLGLMQFEGERRMEHAMAGYLLLKSFPPFSRVADMVRFHHLPWRDGAGASYSGEKVPIESHLIHLADRVSVLVPRDRDVLGKVDSICKRVQEQSGRVFVPEHVNALDRIRHKDYIWLEAASADLGHILQKSLAPHAEEMDLDGLLDFSKLLCRIIDFKSEFTATHTSGLAATSVLLAEHLGFDHENCKLMQISAYLHDLGKLAVPTEILEKPAQLDASEWHVMRSHAYYTYQILEPIESFRVITSWSALHHERLNGKGYPFSYDESDIPMGARILGVVDVFVGITEDRPYRSGMSQDEARNVLSGMASRKELDQHVVQALLGRYEEMNAVRKSAQAAAIREYEDFRHALLEASKQESVTVM
ncbi:MAG: HD domain-containing protein, partial [Candidatus Hydrogenedentes bacterium]|nr:HD domain-containing protein [Candidatus Hydrogenedentota bacterium]